MRICVAGLWHLGVVTAACVAAAGHRVVAFDDDESVVAGLDRGVLPVDEPGLAELVREQLAAETLRFTARRDEALQDAELVWITYDTPVDPDDRADVETVVTQARAVVDASDPRAAVVVSSQLPVGTTRLLEEAAGRGRTFAYSPENLRLGKAVAAFEQPDRIVVGIRRDADRSRIETLLSEFTDRIEWMSIESAELVKHGVNAFLALSIAFANELATIAERVGADAAEVERGLKTESRIGARAYLRPGAAFAGGTLARDLDYLSQIGEREHVAVHLLRAIRTSNDEHKKWAKRTVDSLVGAGGDLSGHVIGIWGLVYKQGTDTLRRSSSIELCRELARAGATVKAHDPAVRALEGDVARSVVLCPTPLEAAADASVVVVETDWPSFRAVAPEQLMEAMRTPIVVDANGFLSEMLGDVAGVRYLKVGSRAS